MPWGPRVPCNQAQALWMVRLVMATGASSHTPGPDDTILKRWNWVCICNQGVISQLVCHLIFSGYLLEQLGQIGFNADGGWRLCTNNDAQGISLIRHEAAMCTVFVGCYGQSLRLSKTPIVAVASSFNDKIDKQDLQRGAGPPNLALPWRHCHMPRLGQSYRKLVSDLAIQ